MLLPWPQAALGTEAKDSKDGLPWWSSGYSELPVQGPGFHPWSRGGTRQGGTRSRTLQLNNNNNRSRHATTERSYLLQPRPGPVK